LDDLCLDALQQACAAREVRFDPGLALRHGRELGLSLGADRLQIGLDRPDLLARALQLDHRGGLLRVPLVQQVPCGREVLERRRPEKDIERAERAAAVHAVGPDLERGLERGDGAVELLQARLVLGHPVLQLRVSKVRLVVVLDGDVHLLVEPIDLGLDPLGLGALADKRRGGGGGCRDEE
jgi:hypothetical protein